MLYKSSTIPTISIYLSIWHTAIFMVFLGFFILLFFLVSFLLIVLVLCVCLCVYCCHFSQSLTRRLKREIDFPQSHNVIFIFISSVSMSFCFFLCFCFVVRTGEGVDGWVGMKEVEGGGVDKLYFFFVEGEL